jgi:hypothetical protein
MEILLPVILILALFGFLYWASKSGKRMLSMQNERLKRALHGKARIISQTPFGNRGTNDFGQYQCVRIKLEVWNDTLKPYQVFTYWNAGTLAAPYIEVGKEVKVKIDADNHEVIFPSGIPSVEYSFSSEKKGSDKG